MKTLTATIIKSKKALLMVSLVAAALVDIAVVCGIALGGFNPLYCIVPIVLLALDAVYFLAILNSNFRFRYSIVVPLVVESVKMAVVLGFFIYYYVSYGVFYIHTAVQVLWGLAHLVSLLCVVLYVVGNGRLAVRHGARAKGVQRGAAAMGALVCVFGAAYVVIMLLCGLFGQGIDAYRVADAPALYDYQSRTPAYRLNDNGGYTVMDALEGKGSTLVVPATFNGIPVNGIDCRLFANDSISAVVLQWGTDQQGTVADYRQQIRNGMGQNAEPYLQLFNDRALLDRSTTVKVYAAPSVCDDLRRQLYNSALFYDGREVTELADSIVQFAACVLPDVQEGETFYTFDYDLDSLRFLSQHYFRNTGLALVPTWVGDQRSDFDLQAHLQTSVEDSPTWDYMRHVDCGNVTDLHWNYRNNDARIFVLTEQGGHQKATFRTIYRVGVGDGNDAVYTQYIRTHADYRPYDYTFVEEDSAEVGGVRYRYTYVVADGFDDLLDAIRPRTGFEVQWQYAADNAADTPRTDLDRAQIAAVLATWQDGYVLYPHWDLDQPVVSAVVSSLDTFRVTYGEDLSLQPTVVAPYANARLQYTWRLSGTVMGTQSTLSIDNINPIRHAGRYQLQVVAGDDQTTSLTAEGRYDVQVTVDKKALHFVWNDATDEHEALGSLVYAANTKTVTGTWLVSDVLCENGVDLDTIEVVYSDNVGLDAADYTAKVALAGHCADLYTIATDQGSSNQCSFTVAPYTLDVQWGNLVGSAFVAGNTQYIYDKTAHCPVAYAQVAWGENVAARLLVSGGIVEAGDGVADVRIEDGNFAINAATATCAFRVLPKEIGITWREAAGYCFVYDGTQQGVQADLDDGVIEGDVVQLRYSGIATNAGNYTMVAVLTNANYTFPAQYATTMGDRLDYVIAPRSVTLVWAIDPNHEYDAKAFLPDIEVGNVVEGDSVHVQVSGSQVDVGDYTATATALDNANYCLPTVGTTCDYAITRRTLTLAADARYKVYDGYRFDTTQYSYVATNAVDDMADIATVSYADSPAWNAVNRGTYDIVLTYAPGAKANNYTFITRASTLVIDTRSISVVAEDKSKVYDGNPYGGLFTYRVNGLAATDVEADVLQSVDFGGAAITAYNAGTYSLQLTVEAGGAKTDNYAITTQNAKLTIERAAITLDWAQPYTFTYDGTAKNLSATMLGLAERDQSSPPQLTYSEGNTKAGSYTARATLTADNYTLVASSAICGYVIDRRVVGFAWDDQRTFAYDGTAHAVQGYADNLLAGDSLAYAGQQIDAGSGYTMTATVPNDNYVFGDGTTRRSVTFAVQPRPVTLRAEDKTKEYDGMVLAAGDYSAAVDALTPLASGDTLADIVQLQYTGLARVGINVGTYPIGMALAEQMAKYDNYTITYQGGSLTITPRPLSLVWQEQRTFTYDAIPKSIAATAQNVVTGDRVELAYSGAAIDSGNHTMTATVVANDNYQIVSGATCNYYVRKRDLTIRADNIRRTYSGTVYDDFSVSCDGLVDDLADVVTLVFGGTATTAINCGSGYTIIPATGEVGAKAGNYNAIQYENGTLQIVPKTLTMQWDQPYTFTYDGTTHNLTGSLVGVVERDQSSPPTIVYSEGQVNAGTYTATAAIDAANYTLDAATASHSFTIERRVVHLEWDEQRLFYFNGTAQGVKYSVAPEDLVESDPPVARFQAGPYSYDAGNFTLKVIILNSNYVFADGTTQMSVDYTILPKTVTAVWPEDDEYVYSGDPVSHTPTFDGLVKEDHANAFVYTYTNVDDNTQSDTAPTAAGLYRVQVRCNSGNYTIDNDTAYFSIVAVDD